MKTHNQSQSKSEVPQEGLYPEIIREGYKGSEKLLGRKALISGGDSGIGQAVAVHFAREGADVSIIYKESDDDAEETKKLVEEEGRQCLLLKGDISDKAFRKQIIDQIAQDWGKIDILVNNAAIQSPKNEIENISDEQILKTFNTNIISMISFTRDCLSLMQQGSRIICTTSVTAYRGSDHLIDYSSTKGAIATFIRSMATNLAEKKILVNGIAPGPIWTPLVKETFDDVSDFGKDTPLKRAGQPSEVAPAFVFLASEDSSYITGDIIHINGGDFVGG
ncbi:MULTISPECIES: SDR family oxidoreductase [Chryseobacterium]|uniref:NAD(P)-dependent dehydrogenase (Short-subunit alcohol dehydrogenase family) n=1 Tax=Chryseobacterium camelliae TaxID=1265445 RepID=A0ABU0TEU7_9FLAO|nr:MULTISPECIES: SDR family oxidoreductase [Chryseobacterium]MDT3406616.1 NAD(P)-dependent dehydrogenase (short-subunit alcohol dehydrogenase family) [Pseudacidovorax intermedius]MDQ1095588.1 NAD(P)-dependent dehydrogenase (short-subunit alcohol dehydrogenase family) [Chryseobacterium camelliae]MDQ1099524.1 NAD(P)-dependent dehydrogenase (short-subunit alcohol dehydrogenase family) [Chryseobacterium sp. SORGH_AS_1048]MDR6086871.1 NAD(P)-dependent dehydrogenase (short-subunit alcohol dehydrogena